MTTHLSSTLADFIEILAHERPNEVVSTFKDEINFYTMSEINKKAKLLAKGLLYNGIDKGSPVGLIMSCTSNCLTFVLALSKIGAVLIPFDKDIKLKKLEIILQNEKVQTICFDADKFMKKFKTILPEYCQNERGYLQSDKFPHLRNIISFGSVKSRGVFTTRELMLLGMHMDDIEMETRVKNIKADDIFIKQVTLDEKENVISEIKTHGEIVTHDFTFPALQNLLYNSI